MTSLIEGIRQRIADPRRASDAGRAIGSGVVAPASDALVDSAELALGFVLPPLLRRLYVEIGNGGFGPSYGLLGVPTEGTASLRRHFYENHFRNIQLPRDDPRWWPAELVPVVDFDIVETYQRLAQDAPEDPSWRWPAKLIPIFVLGCGMYECVDCSKPDGPIVWFEPNPREPGDPLEDFLIELSPSLAQRLEAWIAGEDLMESAYEASTLKRRLDEHIGQ